MKKSELEKEVARLSTELIVSERYWYERAASWSKDNSKLFKETKILRAENTKLKAQLESRKVVVELSVVPRKAPNETTTAPSDLVKRFIQNVTDEERSGFATTADELGRLSIEAFVAERKAEAERPFQIGDRVVCVRVGQCWGETGTITRINNSRWWEQYAMKLDNPAPMFDSVVGSDRTFRLLAQDKETP